MADAAVDLTTLAAAKTYLAGVSVTPPADGVLQELITAISAELQRFLSRRLPSQTYSLNVNGRGDYALFLPNTPITAVDLLMIDNAAIDAAPSGGAGYIINPDAIYLRGYSFSRGIQNVAVTYTAGYALNDMPADIVRAAHEAIRAGCKSTDFDELPSGVVRYKAGDTEIHLGGITALAQMCVTPQITSMLTGHQRVIPC